MKISFWISATVFCVVSVALCNSVQVGTVLFTTTDLVKKCWTECDKSLLKTRLIMQDVLPDPDYIDFSNPEVVMILLEYFHACFQIISTSTYGKIQNLMYIALSDALGGYLRAYMLPFTKRAYYAGQLKYTEAKKLFQLYDDIKVFLKTNGLGWAKPQKVIYRKVYVTPLPITGGALEACHQLFTIEKPGKLHCFKADYCFESDDPTYDELKKNSIQISREVNPREAAKNSKRFSNLNLTFESKQGWRNWRKIKRFVENFEKLNFTNVMNNSRDGRKFFKNLIQTVSRNSTQKLPQETEIPEVRKSRCDCKCPHCKQSNCPYRRIIVPLPVLDDCESPHSIAVPFKKRPFRNLRTRSSAFVLEYYYVTVIKCFIAKGNTRADIKNFNANFHSWLISQVYPHLSEEQWYPGFGGVLRVFETIKRFGIDSSVGDPLLQDIGYMFDSGVEFEVAEHKRKEKARNVDEFEEGSSYSKRHVLTSIIIVSLIWIFVFCACAFYFQATRGRYLLYEGYSEARLFRRQCKDSSWNEKFVDFQFLIQFFKKKDAPECKKEESEILMRPIDSTDQSCPRSEKKSRFGRSKRKKDSKRTKKKQTVPRRDEDISFEKYLEPIKCLGPGLTRTWPCQPCLVPFDKIDAQDFDQLCGGDHKNQFQKNQIQTLWKKSSKKFKTSTALKEGREKRSSKRRSKLTTAAETTSEETYEESSSKSSSTSAEDETKSIEKPSSSCCCSENCYHTYSTTTNTTSNTQIEEKLSSATMEFFEEVISRHKLLKKYSTTQETTEESDSEEEGSSLSRNNS